MPSLPSNLEALILGKKRQVAGIIPDVVISEHHIDELVVTKHPVDVGASVSDHAYLQPAVIRCQFGWSNSSILVNSLLSLSIFKGIQTIEDVYDKFIELLKKRERFFLSTGKRQYQSVVLTKVEEVTTSDTENSLILDVTFEEVRVAMAKTTTLEAAKQKNPEKTASVSNSSTKYPIRMGGAQ